MSFNKLKELIYQKKWDYIIKQCSIEDVCLSLTSVGEEV